MIWINPGRVSRTYETKYHERGTQMAGKHIDSPEVQRANLKFIRTSMDTPLLEREHELDLARRWKDKKDVAALHELIEAHMRLVVAIASKFKNYGLPLGDLIQEGNIGLMEAANRFEPDRENRFSTYATWWVRATIQDYVLRNWSIVRNGTSASQKALFFNLRRLKSQLRETENSTALIAKELGVSEQSVEDMSQRLAASDQSLNSPLVANEDAELQDFVADERPNPEDIVIGARNAETRTRWLNEALGTLSARERAVIRERRMADNGATLEDLGKELGISKERVRQIEQRALEKLRELLTGKLDKAGLGSDKSMFFVH